MRSSSAASKNAGPTAGTPVGSALGVGAAEKLRRVGCALPEARALGDCEGRAERETWGLREVDAEAVKVADSAVLGVAVVEPMTITAEKVIAGGLPFDQYA